MLNAAEARAAARSTRQCEASRCRVIRLAEPFEALRDAADRGGGQGKTPGGVSRQSRARIRDFTARAAFAKNFFEAGGIEARSNEGFLKILRVARRIQGLGRADRLPLFVE